jgi:hypothetical protein
VLAPPVLDRRPSSPGWSRDTDHTRSCDRPLAQTPSSPRCTDPIVHGDHLDGSQFLRGELPIVALQARLGSVVDDVPCAVR